MAIKGINPEGQIPQPAGTESTEPSQNVDTSAESAPLSKTVDSLDAGLAQTSFDRILQSAAATSEIPTISFDTSLRMDEFEIRNEGSVLIKKADITALFQTLLSRFQDTADARAQKVTPGEIGSLSDKAVGSPLVFDVAWRRGDMGINIAGDAVAYKYGANPGDLNAVSDALANKAAGDAVSFKYAPAPFDLNAVTDALAHKGEGDVKAFKDRGDAAAFKYAPNPFDLDSIGEAVVGKAEPAPEEKQIPFVRLSFDEIQFTGEGNLLINNFDMARSIQGLFSDVNLQDSVPINILLKRTQ